MNAGRILEKIVVEIRGTSRFEMKEVIKIKITMMVLIDALLGDMRESLQDHPRLRTIEVNLMMTI